MERILRKINRSFRRLFASKIQVFIAVLILIALVSLVLTLNYEPQKKSVAKYELTETDIFSLENFNANDISVMGVKVGDRTQQLLKVLGTPDLRSDFDGVISTLEYSKAIGLNSTGLIISSEHGIVTAITVREPFSKFLKGKTKPDYTKQEVYAMYGIPDKTIFMPIEEGSFIVIRVMRYLDRGIDFIIRKDNAIGFSLFLNDENAYIPGTHTTEIIESKPEIIK